MMMAITITSDTITITTLFVFYIKQLYVVGTTNSSNIEPRSDPL